MIGKHGIIQPRLHYQATAAKKDNGSGGGTSGGGQGGEGGATADGATRGSGSGAANAAAVAGETEEDAAERLRNLQRMGDWGR